VLGVVDVIASDTWALATHGLATTGQLERGDLTLYMDLFPEKMSAQYTPRVVAPGAERRPSWWIFSQLGRRLGLELPGAETPSAESELALLREIAATSATPWSAPGDDAPSVAIADPPRPRGWVLRGALAEGRWNLAPAPLIERLARIEEPPPLVLIPRRSVRRMNSALRDLAPAVGAPEDREALVHPEDALAAGVAHGERVRITSTTGALEATLRTSPEIARGAISIPHGLTEPNVGSLTTGRVGGVDPLTGMVIQSGIEVRLEPA
jgi:anaerobic selenocysteine-containing dehydrogenase